MLRRKQRLQQGLGHRVPREPLARESGGERTARARRVAIAGGLLHERDEMIELGLERVALVSVVERDLLRPAPDSPYETGIGEFVGGSAGRADDRNPAAHGLEDRHV